MTKLIATLDSLYLNISVLSSCNLGSHQKVKIPQRVKLSRLPTILSSLTFPPSQGHLFSPVICCQHPIVYTSHLYMITIYGAKMAEEHSLSKSIFVSGSFLLEKLESTFSVSKNQETALNANLRAYFQRHWFTMSRVRPGICI